MPPPIIWLASTRPAFESRWRRACEAVGLEARAVAPARLEEQLAAGCGVVIDGHDAPDGDEDQLLATVALARTADVVVAVVFEPSGTPRPAGWPARTTVDLLEDLTGGLTVHGVVNPDQVVATIQRRLDRSRSARFELVTTTPTGDGILAVWGDGRAERRLRPLGGDDDGSDVVAIRLSSDALEAELELEGGTVLRWDARDRGLGAAAKGDALADPRQLGERLRALRLAAGITQAELARRTGIHRPNIARVEAGRHTPSLETLSRIASAMGLRPSTILED